MAFTYNLATDRGKVRLLISDTNAADTTLQVFQDDEVDVFLAMNVGVKRAAAAALLVMAGSVACLDKVIRSQDLATDGAKVADALRALARDLRAEAVADEDDADDGGLSVIDFNGRAGYQTSSPTYWSG